MATLPVKVVPHGGLVLSGGDYSPASDGGDKAPVGGGMLLVVQNSDAAPHTVTLAVPEKVDNLAVSSRAVEVPAGDQAFIPLLPLYAAPGDGLAAVTYDAAASLTVAVIRAA